MMAKKNIELNPSHPVMKSLLEQLKENDGQLPEDWTEYVDLLYNMALINSGFMIEEPMDLTEPLEKLIRVGFGVSRDEPCEDIEIELDEPEQEPEDVEDEDEEPEEMDVNFDEL